MSWFADEVTWEEMGALRVPTCTLWRCREAFCTRGTGGRAPSMRRAIRHLMTWLSIEQRGLRLRLVLEVGGGSPRRAWLGLVVQSATIEACRRSVERVAADLGEALDVWGLFPDPPTAPPALTGPVRGVAPMGAGRRQGTDGPRSARIVPTLELLDRRAHRLALVLDLEPTDVSPGLIKQVSVEQARAKHLVDAEELPWFASRSASTLGHARGELERLWQQVVASRLTLRVVGSPLGTLLTGLLEEALSDDLGMPVQLVEAAPSPLPGGRHVLDTLFGVLSAGATPSEADEDAETPDADAIPF